MSSKTNPCEWSMRFRWPLTLMLSETTLWHIKCCQKPERRRTCLPSRSASPWCCFHWVWLVLIDIHCKTIEWLSWKWVCGEVCCGCFYAILKFFFSMLITIFYSFVLSAGKSTSVDQHCLSVGLVLQVVCLLSRQKATIACLLKEFEAWLFADQLSNYNWIGW